ncbi:MAG: LysR family transcriptional regulator [Enterococcus aquimarinus]|uniref:LysR family transcriptional regulator n=1 Tax=Jeotgalibaca porci TaxID=1868793 RepID=UPI00359FD8E2
MFQIFKTFVSVYETHNFTRTADKLYLSQPTVSSQIKKLEEQLQVSLFIRNGKQEIIPTKEADFLYPRIIKIMEEWTDLTVHIHSEEIIRESCVLACTQSCGMYLLPTFVPKLIEKFPMIDFEFPIMGYQDIVHGVEQAKFDFGLIEWAERSEQLKRYIVARDELVLAGDPLSPYWLLNDSLNPLREINDQYLRDNNLLPIFIRTNSFEMIKNLLNQGVGRAIISKLALAKHVPYETLDVDNLRNFYFLTREEVISKLLGEVALFIKTELKNEVHL